MNEAVFVLMGIVCDYEDTPLLAFASEEDAEYFKNACNDYNKTKETGSFEGAERVAYFERLAAWYKNHPAGDEVGRDFDFFSVVPVPLIRSPKCEN